MKRTFLTATAAIALMTAPAIAQVADTDIETQTEAEITTDIPDVQIEGDVTSDTTLDTETPTATTPSWDGDTELENDTFKDGDGMGGAYYESEEDAIADSDLEADTDVEIETPGADIDVDVETETEYNDEAEAKLQMNDQYGSVETYGDTKVTAEASSDLNEGQLAELNAEKSAQVAANTDTEMGVGGPEATDAEDAAARYGDINEVANPDVDVDGLTEYEEEQIEKAGEDAAQDIDKLEKDSTKY
jgi:hypothetical protein